ncbi:2OG-Fe(II) oxygenase [Rhodanobacter sp. FW510-R12]|uniref:2OG-Fe(II) oxygenase n=1 Tax=unclassified Rhodanobacter TaxID=2621553 RepID=UPI0007A9A6E1|nr:MULTISPECIES: 2OG-Fe(II) oxygenase [unclassified Rhodanobacter]KZC17389.1 2OG-Fe(II) oxygenase [Rhodanobacter sp. FW104-R8]KZC27922.1 2OG-Fe(II) oxygenase [Rhodanobacter sp. FW510-T8]KZC32109.1 2OG-Fe(II) oxygenase [Rhodanobacter sp. FW510-R10]
MTPETVSPPICDLRGYVQVFDDSLPVSFCQQLVASFHQARDRHVTRRKGWRAGLDESSWTELDITPLADDAFKGFFYRKIDDYLSLYNRQFGLTIPVPTSTLLDSLRIKRYVAGSGEAFQPHFDSLGEVSNRYMVFLWYLNDVEKGGETEFCDLGIKVSARTGRLLMFPPYWMFQHAGRPPISGDKYILSTYLLFPPAPA